MVECKGKIEGYGLLFINKERKLAEVGALYFTKEVLGLGLGKEIVEHMKKVAKDLGHREIFLSSTKTSKKFYEKQGFWQYDDDDSTLIGGVLVEGHPMKIEL